MFWNSLASFWASMHKFPVMMYSKSKIIIHWSKYELNAWWCNLFLASSIKFIQYYATFYVCFSSLIISGIRFTIIDEYFIIPRYIEFKFIACFYLNISASYFPSKSTVQINCNHVAMQTLCNSLCAYKTKKGR